MAERPVAVVVSAAGEEESAVKFPVSGLVGDGGGVRRTAV